MDDKMMATNTLNSLHHRHSFPPLEPDALVLPSQMLRRLHNPFFPNSCAYSTRERRAVNRRALPEITC
jgi:hypothetical protein